MGVGYFPCDECNEVICDVGDFFSCDDCEKILCTICIDKITDKLDDIVCPYCTYMVVDDSNLLKFAVDKLGITKDQLIEEFKATMSAQK